MFGKVPLLYVHLRYAKSTVRFLIGASRKVSSSGSASQEAETRVSEPSAELINLCPNEATHHSPHALTAAHRAPQLRAHTHLVACSNLIRTKRHIFMNTFNLLPDQTESLGMIENEVTEPEAFEVGGSDKH